MATGITWSHLSTGIPLSPPIAFIYQLISIGSTSRYNEPHYSNVGNRPSYILLLRIPPAVIDVMSRRELRLWDWRWCGAGFDLLMVCDWVARLQWLDGTNKESWWSMLVTSQQVIDWGMRMSDGKLSRYTNWA